MLCQNATTRSCLSRYWSRPWTILRPKKKASPDLGTTRPSERAGELNEVEAPAAPTQASPTAGMSQAEKLAYFDKKMQTAAREKELAAKAKTPEVTPELKRASIEAYRKLPRDRQLILKQLMKVSCAYCEKQFDVPNIGESHGMCERHRAEYFQKLGKTLPPSRSTEENKPVDLGTLSDEERQLGVKLFSILRQRDVARQKRTTNS